jgi:succinyl-diaminopimelate desuccinylase
LRVSDVLDLTIDLCRRPSLTPEDAGCQDAIAARLARAGFTIEPLHFGAVRNLWATHGHGDPVLMLLGHTDVVPSGPAERWSSPPFEPHLADGVLRARGAADMKGSVAAMTLALQHFAASRPRHAGTVGLLLTSDEEGDAIDGVRRVAQTFRQRGQRVDWCLVGEPSSDAVLGDQIRIGRRGSLTGYAKVLGTQGHVAFAELARNPIHALAPALAELVARHWDDGGGAFPPTGFQVANLAAGTGATNVIPGELALDFNFRFGTASTAADLQRAVEECLARHGVVATLRWRLSGEPFLTGPGPLRDAVVASVRELCGREPVASTGGGTSDGRFVAPLGAQVVELGPSNRTIHQVDECVRVADLETLERLHLRIMERLLPVP